MMIHLFNIEIGQKPAVLALSIIIKNQEISSRIPLTLQEIIKIPPITGDFMTDFIQLQEHAQLLIKTLQSSIEKGHKYLRKSDNLLLTTVKSIIKSLIDEGEVEINETHNRSK